MMAWRDYSTARIRAQTKSSDRLPIYQERVAGHVAGNAALLLLFLDFVPTRYLWQHDFA